MKTKLYLLALMPLFLFSSCQSDPDKEIHSLTDFQKELTDLSDKQFDLFTTTRSGEQELNVDAFNEMIEQTVELSQKYGLEEQVTASGYYSKMDETLVGMDMYETMRYFEANSTPEFNELISRIIVDEKTIDNEEIIKNNKLLPNEQLALITINRIIEEGFLDVDTRGIQDILDNWHPTAESCRNAYNREMSKCNNNLYAGSGLTVFVAVTSFGTLATAVGVAVAIDYANCSGEAMNMYMICMEHVS